MAIDGRFSLAAFQATRSDPARARTLSDDLQREVTRELHNVIGPAVRLLVDRLNALGHNLRPYGELLAGDLPYRDELVTEAGPSCRLRLGVDTVVSVGFADTVDGDDL